MYWLIGFVITLIASTRAISFSVWQFKEKNVIGGIFVAFLAILGIVLMFLSK